MDIVKAFIDNDETNNITIKFQEDGEPIFQANEIAKILGIKNIHETLKNFDNDEKHLSKTDTQGGVQNVTFLTEIGLYRLLNISRKPIARTFQKWVANVVKEIRKTGHYKLENTIKDIVDKNEKEYELKIHNNLIQLWKQRNGVYVGKIKTEINDNNIILKIGSTKDIDERAIQLKKEFKTEVFILNFFEANRYVDFEKSIFREEKIKQFQYTDEINGHKSTETFCIPKDFYNELISIISKKQKEFDGALTNEQLFELSKMNKQIELENIQLQKLQLEKNIPITPDIIFKEVPPAFIPNENKKVGKGYKIQKYTLDGQLVCTYNGISFAERKEPRLGAKGLREAIKNNYIYNDHRWAFLNRDLPNDTIQTLPEVKEHKMNKLDFIVMLDITKQKIVKVFEDQIEASTYMQLKTTVSIYNSIKKGSLCRGHYFINYSDCPEEIKNEYLKNNTLPAIKRRFNSIQVKQINPITNEVMKVFQAYTDIVREYQMSMGKLKQIITSGEIYKGYIWSH